jgi:Leucine-rich repeat (LRR) protein
MGLTKDQIIHGFWYKDREHDWPPSSITRFEDYAPTEKLNLVITQLDVSSYQQGKIVDIWCQALPNFKEVKYLWFHSRVNQKMFDAACKMPNLVGLNVKWSGIKHITGLQYLKKLRYLHLGGSSQVESIDILGDLNGLITLELEQLNKISDFSIISKLSSLEGLGLDGSIWTAQKIDTLKPLQTLSNLKYLTLTNTRIQDQSLRPILALTELVRFYCSWNYPEEEFEKLKSMSNLKYGNVETSWREHKEKYYRR